MQKKRMENRKKIIHKSKEKDNINLIDYLLIGKEQKVNWKNKLD